MKLGRMVTVILAAACVVSMAGCGQKQAPAGTAEAPKTTEAATAEYRHLRGRRQMGRRPNRPLRRIKRQERR